MTYYSFFMGEKKDKENMAKKRTQILDSGGLASPYFLFPQSFVVVCININSVVEFQRWWVLKSKVFGQESTYSMDFFRNPSMNYG